MNDKEILTQLAHLRPGEPLMATPRDLARIREARKNGNWQAVHQSKLYRQFGGQFCQLLELLAR